MIAQIMGLSPTATFIIVAFIATCLVISTIVLLLAIWSGRRKTKSKDDLIYEQPEISVDSMLDSMTWKFPSRKVLDA